MGKETKYFKDLIYEGKDTTIFSIKKEANIKTLLKILEEKPLRRKELMKKTYWTRGQLAGLLYRGLKKGLFKLKNRKIYVVDKQ